MDWARSSVRVIEEMIKSIFPVLSDGMSPAKGMFSIRSSLPSSRDRACAISTLIPVGSFCSSVISNGGYDSSIPTTSRLLGLSLEQPVKMKAMATMPIVLKFRPIFFTFRIRLGLTTASAKGWRGQSNTDSSFRAP